MVSTVLADDLASMCNDICRHKDGQIWLLYIDGLVQDCSIYSALVLHKAIDM